jgi:site-specific recombinase XerD
MGWLHKRGWFYKYPEQGGAGGMNTAIDAITAVLRRASNVSLPEVYRAQLNDWGQYLAINRGLSSCTMENYLHGVAGWMRYLVGRSVDVAAATPRDVIEWQRVSFVDRNEVGATRALNLSAVRQFYEWCEQNGAINNPARVVKGPKKTKRMPKKFTSQQLSAIFRSINRKKPIGIRDFTILVFFYGTGARLNEVAMLRLGQISLHKNSGAVTLHGKGGKQRHIPFPKEVAIALHEWLIERGKIATHGEDALFLGMASHNKGRRLKRAGIIAVMARAMRRAGIDKNPDDPTGVHRLRSSYATSLYDNGKDLLTIQNRLGHERPETTQLYIAISDRQLRQGLPDGVISKLLEEVEYVPRYIRKKARFRQEKHHQ